MVVPSGAKLTRIDASQHHERYYLSNREVDARLQNLLGGPALAPLRQRLRNRFAQMPAEAPPTVLRLSRLTAIEYDALALLTGCRPGQAQSIQLDLVTIDATLTKAGIASSLRDALELLDGPIEHAASVRAMRHAQWSHLVTACHDPDLAGYLKEPVALGVLKRLSRQDLHRGSQLLQQVQAILSRLPANGLPRAQLAAEVLGNAHALDNGQATATLVLAVWRRRSDPCRETEGTEAGTDDSEWRDESARETWARAGVMVNELARPALVLNLPLQGREAGVSPAGEPGYVSLRRLLRAKPDWDVGGRTVFVCENPNVVAIAADRLGADCAPLVCTDGMPAAAQRTLLDQLCGAGARLCYHGDFDWPGVGIANYIMRAWAARPWRFSVSDYEAAVSTVPSRHRDLPEGNIVASWDAALACVMRRHGLAIAEEAVVGSLLQDLGPQL